MEPSDTPVAARNILLLSSGAIWTNLTDPSAPPSLDYAAMAFDPVDNYTVLFGGQAAGAYPTNQTWMFTNGSWTNITSIAGQAPIPRDGMAMAYDPVDRYILAYGGGSFLSTCSRSSSDSCDTTWAFYSGRWHIVATSGTLPDVSMQFSMTYDSADGYVLATDGTDTWKYLGGTWTPFCGSNCTSFVPGPDLVGSVAYDASDAYVLFSGQGYTWKFHSGSWTNISTSSGTAPSSREYFSMASDTEDGSVMEFSGLNSTSSGGFSYLNDTWSFSGGTWANVTSQVAPSARYGAAFAFDAPEDGFVLFGGDTQLGSSGDLNDTWFLGPHAPIGELSVLLSPSLPRPGENTTFAVNFSGGTGPFSYSWIFGDGGTSANANPTHLFRSVGFFVVSVWVNDSLDDRAAGSIRVHVFVPLSVSTLTASPNPAILDQPVNFSISPVGGSPPYTLSWAFGDGGVGGNLTNVTHIFTTDGPFTVEATLSDSTGALVRASVNVTIQLQALAGVSQSSASSPLTVDFLGQAQGGIAPYSFNWSFGDGTVAEIQNPAHTFSTVGVYSVSLTVTDAKGQSSKTNLSVQVGSPSKGGSVSAPSSWLLPALLGLIIGITVAAILTVAIVQSRRRRREGEEWIRELTAEHAGAQVGRGPRD
jgi:PKD repeat protein